MTAPNDIAITQDSPAVSGSVQRLVGPHGLTFELHLGDWESVWPVQAGSLSGHRGASKPRTTNRTLCATAAHGVGLMGQRMPKRRGASAAERHR